MPDTSQTTDNASPRAEGTSPLEMKFKSETPKNELDELLVFSDEKSTYDQLEAKEMDAKEKDKDRREKRYFTAFKLIIGCLAFLGVIYLVEVCASVSGKTTPSDVTNGIIEIVKTLLFTLSGYLFARKENGD